MSKFNTAQLKIIRDTADRIGVAREVLLAFVDVESASVVSVVVDGKRVPLIRWEGHYFDKLVPARMRSAARRQGLASPKAQAIKNPESQSRRYKILAKAKTFDYAAAVGSCSWGIGQVMGDNWEWLGYKSARDFERTVMSGFAGQLEAMIRFIEKSGIVPHLERRDWSAAARIYNGPKYAKNRYHIKLRQRYEFYRDGRRAEQPRSAGMLRAGSSGVSVRELQQMLGRAGIAVQVDGDFGPATERAVMEWQRRAGIDVDGIAGPLTMQTLSEYAVADDRAGSVPLQDVKEIRTATKTAAPTALVLTLREEIAGVATQLTGIDTEIAVTIGDWLMAGAGVLGVGLAGYAVLGLVRSRQTRLGIEEVR